VSFHIVAEIRPKSDASIVSLHGQNHGNSVEIWGWSFKNGATVDRCAASEVTSGFHEHAVSMPLLPSCPDHLIEEERALL
jgi:hypothetical protein